MQLSVIKKLLLLILSLSVTFSTSSYARNDQKGGRAFSAPHGGGGHGAGGGVAFRVAHARGFGDSADAQRQFSTSEAQVRHRYAGRLIGVPRTDRTQVASGLLVEEMR